MERIDNGRKLFSFGMLIAMVWLMTAVIRPPISEWLSPPGITSAHINAASGSPIDRLVDSFLLVITVAVLIRRRVPWRKTLKDNAMLAMLFMYMGLSILWSHFPLVSSKRCIRSTGVLLFSLIVLSEGAPVEAVKMFLRRGLAILIASSAVLIIFFPGFGISTERFTGNKMWVGVTSHKNSLGQLASVSAVFFLWNVLNPGGKTIGKRVTDIFMLGLCLWLLWGCNSMTSVLCFIPGALVVVGMRLFDPSARKIGYVIVALLFIVTAAQFTSMELNDTSLLDAVIEATGRNTTLTGRTYLWHDVLEIAARHPIAGRGYGSFWIGDLGNDLWDTFRWKPNESHNGYIDVYVELGLIGLALLCGFLVSSYRHILRGLPRAKEFGHLQLAMLAMLVIYNIAESSFIKPDGILWPVFVLLSLASTYTYEKFTAPPGGFGV